MADKFLNVTMSDATSKPLKIDNVVTITSAYAAGVATFTLTYSSGGTAALARQGDAAAIYVPATAAQLAEVVRTLWNIIASSASQPWNQPFYQGVGYSWDNWTVQPASSQASSYYEQDANPAGSSTFAAKNSNILEGQNNAAADGDMTSGWASIT